MRKKIKLFCYVILVFLITMFFSYNTSTIEVTTEVKGKLAGECLSKYGGTVKLIKVDDWHGTDAGGKVEISGPDLWTNEQPFELKVRAAASGGDYLNKVKIKIYDNKDKEGCEEEISAVDGFDAGSYKNATFMITFQNKSLWKYIDGWQIDSNGQIGTHGKHTIRLDVDEPKIYDFDYSIVTLANGVRTLNVEVKIKDNFNHLDFKSIVLTAKKDGKEVLNRTDAKPSDDDPDIAYISGGIVLDTVGEGEFNFIISARDKYGNFLKEDGYYVKTEQTDLETGETAPSDEGELIKKEPSSSETQSSAPKDDEALSDDFGLLGNENYELTCEGEISNFINKLWNILLIAGPVLMLVMSTIEFVKPILASDADALSKAGSNTVKRAIAFVCLLLLKVILATVLNLFNIQICW